MLEKPILILTTTMLLCGCAGMSATHPKCTSDPSKAEHHFVTNVSLEDAIETAKKLEIGKVISAELEHELGRAPVYEIEIVSDRNETVEVVIDAATGLVIEQEVED